MKCVLFTLSALVLMLGVSVVNGTAQASSSVTLNQPSPVYGESVSFTEIVPREAFGGGHTPQFHINPLTQVMCYQDSILVMVRTTSIIKATNVGAGMRQGSTGEVRLGGPTGGAFGSLDWAGGSASCVAIVYSTYEKFGQITQTVWATLNFEVGP